VDDVPPFSVVLADPSDDSGRRVSPGCRPTKPDLSRPSWLDVSGIDHEFESRYPGSSLQVAVELPDEAPLDEHGRSVLVRESRVGTDRELILNAGEKPSAAQAC
jgi:hypothetical protein